MRIHRDERGQAIILVALSLPIMLGFVGLATDVGSLLNDKRQLQTAADAAAIAGALSLSSSILNTSNAFITAAQNAAATNGFAVGPGVAVTVNNPPTWPASNYNGAVNNGGQGYVEVTITKSEPTIFLALFGHPSVTVLARAVATNSGPPAACIYTTGPVAAPGLAVTGSLQSSPQCGLVVDSNASPPMNASGPLSMKSIGTVGDCSGGCGTGTPISSIIPYSDPLSFLPQYTCTVGSCAGGGSTLPCTNSLNATGGTSGPLPPGCYTTFNATGANITLSAGTYVINGTGMNLTGGNLSGTGVTFYINSGNVTINNTTLNLSAPNDKTQPFNGILFDDQGAPGTYTATITGLTNPTLQGIMYFPEAPLSILGNGGANLFTDFVAQSLTITGNFTFSDYASAPGVTSPLTSAVLVE